MSCPRHLSPRLPPELISTIVSCLSNDRSTLKSFSLVSKAWLQQCRAYIWHSIGLEDNNDKIIKVVEILRDSVIPESFIQCLTLYFYGRRFHTLFDDLFPALVSQLRSIKALRIYDLACNSHNSIKIVTLTPCLYKLTVLALNCVSFATTDELFELLKLAPLISELYLDFTVKDKLPASSIYQVPTPPLRRLSYSGGDSSLYLWLLNDNKPLMITHLCLTNVLPHQRHVFQVLLQKIGGHLEYLHVRCRSDPHGLFTISRKYWIVCPPALLIPRVEKHIQPFSLSFNKSLRYLCLQDGYLVTSQLNPWKWVPQVFQTVESEDVEEIRWEMLPSHVDSLVNMPAVAIENILSRERFSKLSRFTIRLNFIDVYSKCKEVELVQGFCPRLYKSGRLHIVGVEENRRDPFSFSF